MTSGTYSLRLLCATGLVMCQFLAGTVRVSLAEEPPVAPLTAEEVVRKMVERNEQRAKALESYRGMRTYQLEYHGLSSKSATLVVAMTYRRPDEKKFCIVSESGSELLQARVLKRLLEAEVEAMQLEQRRQTAMSPGCLGNRQSCPRFNKTSVRKFFSGHQHCAGGGLTLYDNFVLPLI